MKEPSVLRNPRFPLLEHVAPMNSCATTDSALIITWCATDAGTARREKMKPSSASLLSQNKQPPTAETTSSLVPAEDVWNHSKSVTESGNASSVKTKDLSAQQTHPPLYPSCVRTLNSCAKMDHASPTRSCATLTGTALMEKTRVFSANHCQFLKNPNPNALKQCSRVPETFAFSKRKFVTAKTTVQEAKTKGTSVQHKHPLNSLNSVDPPTSCAQMTLALDTTKCATDAGIVWMELTKAFSAARFPSKHLHLPLASSTNSHAKITHASLNDTSVTGNGSARMEKTKQTSALLGPPPLLPLHADPRNGCVLTDIAFL